MIELLKQTLEALEIAAEGGRVHFHSYAEALRQAIKELESQEKFCDLNCVWTDHHPDCRLTQTQEPVGRFAKFTDGIWRPVTDYSAGVPPYTHPPQRTWVGLTDDEFNELYDRYVPLTCYALLIEKVEAKLKQKNGYFEEKNT